jgi:hypothetical protein
MKDAYVIGSMCVVAIVIGALLYVYGPSITLPGHVGGSASTMLMQGDDAKTSDRTNYRVTSADELSSLWLLIYGGSGPAAPTVDFSKNEVLAVFDGSHGTGGYAVKVTNVVDSGLSRTVTVEHDTPGKGCVVSDAVTSPYEVVLVSKMQDNATLSHTDVEKTVDCK